MTLRIGTSGYQYTHWRGLLYPDGLPVRRWFERYARVFSTVELNAPFYRLQSKETARRWHDEAPPGFVFASKGSRFITHLKRLRDPRQALGRYFRSLAPLKRHLRVVLWQLPPQQGLVDLERLRAFLEALPSGVRHAFEFRHPAWYREEVCALLDAHGVAFCEHDLLPLQPPRTTGGFRYLRFHGATAPYQGRYGRRALRPVARDLERWRGDAFVYFNNDLGGHALADALELLDLTGARAGAEADTVEAILGA